VIEPVSFEPPLSGEEVYKSSTPLWAIIGKIELATCTLIACGGVISGMAKKKRASSSAASFSASGPLLFSSPPSQIGMAEGPDEIPRRPTQDPAPRTQAPPPEARPVLAVPQAGAEHRNLFGELPCTVEDQDHIRFIVTALANQEYISKGGEMNARGAKLETRSEGRPDPLHPFRFLWTIFSNPDLKMRMPEVFGSWITRVGFMTGVNRGMRRVTPGKSLAEIEPYIADFAATVGTTAQAIRPLILEGAQKNDWRKLVQHLIAAPS